MPEKLSKNFWRHEFACDGGGCNHCGGVAPISRDLVYFIQIMRNILNERAPEGAPEVKFNINSGFRCVYKNDAENGKENSQHLHGLACDIAKPEGVSIEEFSELAEDVLGTEGGGIGLYDTFIHIDVRKNGPARWDRRESSNG